MKVELIDTTASTVRNELMRMCQQMGGLTTGVVLNLVIMTDESDQYDAMRAATQAGREHPCQVLGVIARNGRRQRRLDAEITVGENMPGQMVLLRIHGELNEHVDSVVTPLLVPDTPVVIWWPGRAPQTPAADPLGVLGQRRITDVAADLAPRQRLLAARRRLPAGRHRPGLGQDDELAVAAGGHAGPAVRRVIEATVAAESRQPERRPDGGVARQAARRPGPPGDL